MTTTVSRTSAGRMDLHVSPLGRVEGDLDLRVTVEDGVVTQAWTEAGMFRGFEMILKGKDPQAGLIVTPRICGICGGSHLYKSAAALDVAWRTELPPNALLVRNIAQGCETLQSVPRWFYALFAIDLTNRRYAKAKGYDEAVRRFAPLVGEAYERGVTLSGKPVEVYAIFGGQWPHSSFMIPGGVMCGPTLTDVTRSIAILEQWKNDWLETQLLGCSLDRWMAIKTWEDLLAWADENEAQHNSDLAFFLRFGLEVGLDKFGAGHGNYLAMGTYLHHHKYNRPTIEGRNAALISRSGIYAAGKHYEFDQANVREDHTHSFYQGQGLLHPFEGRTEPIDPADGKRQGKYTWAKAPRYEIPGLGALPLEVGPLARQVVAGKPGEDWQDVDPLFTDIIEKKGPSVLVRALARLHEEAKLYKKVRGWLDELDLHERFYIKPTEYESGKGFGATEAARGALADWIVLENGKIANYQVITPTAWNIGPRDNREVNGPMEQAYVGATIQDPSDPVELGHVARSFDSCLVCTVHAYDAKTGKQLAHFKIGEGMR
ncbi:MAG TPA: nickel-dependent hydrogenase large subunit [Kouleothrix sp.]|uniref:nickel-dependent hydrogenase large subunit n=1 Tax=Kouleothrix sp. TaxID=2779161 RepID=UPI002C11DE4D|nr:nickel-dependent hydrogenase large subunit [Kouleothrix sp.]HRC75248.1 nickel-dependent hydrogenase large subunit [Kouleothrix sp.]